MKKDWNKAILEQYAEKHNSKAANIKAIIFDVDGVLTDGGIIYDTHGNELKKFNVKDGQIFSALQKARIITGAITGRNAAMVARRCDELGVDFHFHGVADKAVHYENVKLEFRLRDEEIAYIGDDLMDLPIINRCGLSACPSDAMPYVKAAVHLQLSKKGGQAVFREFAEYILAAKGLMADIIDEYNY